MTDAAPWLGATTSYEGMPLALRIHVAGDSVANRDIYHTLAVVTHHLAKVRSDGLPVSEYNATLEALDQAIITAYSQPGTGTPVVVETFSGCRNYFAYTSGQGAAEGVLATVRTTFPEHTLTITTKEDPRWDWLKKYREAFPW
jgi:hypothetical protein